MNFASLPTDNLYKFLAFAGATALGLVTYFFLKQRNYLKERIDAHNLDAAILRVDIGWLDTAKAALETDSTNSDDRAEYRSRVREARIAVARLEQHVVVSKRLSQELYRVGQLSIVVGLLALSIASAGFSLWYLRYQVFQDRAVAASVSAPTPR